MLGNTGRRRFAARAQPTSARQIIELESYSATLDSQGLPDGIFSYKKSYFGHILERLGIKIVVIFYNYLEYFTTIWYIL
jgi:hypothetical protein